MRLTAVLRTGILIAEVFLAATVVRAQKPDASADAQTKEAQAKEALGMPPNSWGTLFPRRRPIILPKITCWSKSACLAHRMAVCECL